MSTKEFLDKFGWWKPIFYNPAKRRTLSNRQYVVLCECSICHEEDWIRWQPTIVNGTVGRCIGRDGDYICPDCVDRRKIIDKRNETLGPEGIYNNLKKVAESKATNGYYDSEEFAQSRMDAYETQVKNGTFMQEHEIQWLIDLFGGEHFPCGSVFPDGHHSLMEADWIDHEKKVVIEIDTPDHVKKYFGYHAKKRAYWESEGYRVLNIAVNRSEHKCDHPRRPGYTFTTLCEAHINGTLPRELEVMWNDPWYING